MRDGNPSTTGWRSRTFKKPKTVLSEWNWLTPLGITMSKESFTTSSQRILEKRNLIIFQRFLRDNWRSQIVLTTSMWEKTSTLTSLLMSLIRETYSMNLMQRRWRSRELEKMNLIFRLFWKRLLRERLIVRVNLQKIKLLALKLRNQRLKHKKRTISWWNDLEFKILKQSRDWWLLTMTHRL